jgi:hypothetical protein
MMKATSGPEIGILFGKYSALARDDFVGPS